MTAQRQARAPVQRVGGNQLPAAFLELVRRAGLGMRAFKPIEGQVRAFRRGADQPFPRRHGAGAVALLQPHVPEVQIGGRRRRIEVDGRVEAAHGFVELRRPSSTARPRSFSRNARIDWLRGCVSGPVRSTSCWRMR